jgi:hypothetical protein
MRTTLRIEDSLLRELKQRALREKTSLTQLVNQVLRKGLISDAVKPARRKFRQKTYNMGQPKFDLTKALALADALGDEEIIEKMKRRK